MTTDRDPVDLASALEQLWGPRRGPTPVTAPPAEAAARPLVDGAAEERLSERLRTDVDTLRTELLAAVDERESRVRDDARERASRRLGVDLAGRIDDVAVQVAGLGERFAGLERLVEDAVASDRERAADVQAERARLDATLAGFDAVVAALDASVAALEARIGELAGVGDLDWLRTDVLAAVDALGTALRKNAARPAERREIADLATDVAGLGERLGALERLVETAMARRTEQAVDLDATLAGLDAVVAGLDTAVAGLQERVAEGVAALAADIVREATVAPLRRELRGAKADMTAVRTAVADLHADVSSLRTSVKPAAKTRVPAPATKKATAAVAKKRTPVKAARAPTPTPGEPPDTEPLEPPMQTAGGHRPFRAELATWEEDEPRRQSGGGRAAGEGADRDRRRQVLAEAARATAAGAELDLDDLYAAVTDSGSPSPESEGAEDAKRGRFGSRRRRPER